MPDYTILAPSITAAVLTPNPVFQNGAYTISVTITEKSIVLAPEEWFSGEFYAGEV